MKRFLFLLPIFVLALLFGCNEQTGQKTGYVNCCITKSDGTKQCTSMPQGQCQNTAGAKIVGDCKDCK